MRRLSRVTDGLVDRVTERMILSSLVLCDIVFYAGLSVGACGGGVVRRLVQLRVRSVISFYLSLLYLSYLLMWSGMSVCNL